MSELSVTPGFQPAQTPSEIQADENTREHRVELKEEQRERLETEVRVKQFEDLLNGQQQITQLQNNNQSSVVDPAQEIVDNAVFAQPGQATPI